MTTSRLPNDLMSFCKECSLGLSHMTSNIERVHFLEDILPSLLLNTSLFKTILSDIIEGKDYFNLRYATMFDSELILYMDTDRLFSIRMFLWKPGEYDPIHDHNSWGVVGPAIGKLEVVNYKRNDDGSREDYAFVVESDRRIIGPGETYFVHPLNGGIHKTGNPSHDIIAQLSVYGEVQTKRNYINGFDLEKNSVYPIYAPKTKKQILAKEVLTHLES